MSMWAFMRQFCSYRFGFVKGIIPQSYATLPQRRRYLAGEQSCTVLLLCVRIVLDTVSSTLLVDG
jgi:hypothetical protein